MKMNKKITSFILMACLVVTSMSFQTISAAALIADDSTMTETLDTSDSNNPLNKASHKGDEPTLLNSGDALKNGASTPSSLDIQDSNSLDKMLKETDETTPQVNSVDVLQNDDDAMSSKDICEGDPLATALEKNDKTSPRINNAFINGNILTLNFDERLNNEKTPSVNDFKVNITYNEKSTISNQGLIDPVYSAPLDPVYKSSTNTTVYPVLVDNTKINEISVYDNKAVLTLDNAVTSSSAVTLDYTAGGDKSLCDKAGNAVENFSGYVVANITGGRGLPNFVAEAIYNELDTSLFSEQLARQLYYAMTEYQGSKEELKADANNVVSILSNPNATYKELTDENKLKVCSFFGISDSFFSYSEGKGENIEKTITVYSDMVGYGLTDEEIEQSIQNNTRDQVIAEKKEEGVYQSNSRRLLSAAPASTSTEADPFFKTKYNQKEALNAPFNHTGAASEDINLASGSMKYTATDVILPGAGGLNLTIERQYSTEEAHYYDINAKLVEKVGNNGNPYYSKMTVSMLQNQYSNVENGPYGDLGPQIRDTYTTSVEKNADIDSRKLRELYNKKNITKWHPLDGQECFRADTYKMEMTSSVTDTMSAAQETAPITANERLWQMGTGWKLNFSSIEIDSIYKYKKLHLSDGRDFVISDNWVNNLGFYTYKDVIVSNRGGIIGDQNSSYQVRYADGKKEYFDNDGRLIAIVDRFGNMISFHYTTVNHMTQIAITDTLGRLTTISNEMNGSGYNKIITLPDGKTVKYVISENAERKLVNFNQYESFSGQNNEYNLTSVINQEGEITNYSYTDIKAGSDFSARFKLNEKNKFMTVEEFDDGNKYYPNYYAALAQITYPTGLAVHYDYYPRYNNWYDFGCNMDIAIKKRYETAGNGSSNEKEYEYSNQYRHEGEVKNFLYNADGYDNDPLYDDDPFGFNQEYTVKEKDTGRNITQKYVFDAYNGVCDREETYLGSTLIQKVSNFYRTFNKIPHPSKELAITERYNSSDGKELVTEENFGYDDKGNVVTYWPPLSGKEQNSEYAVFTRYEDPNIYNLLSFKEYKRDKDTAITEKNVLSDDKKNIIQSMVYENGNLVARTDFAYDSYGNLIQVKKYTDLSSGNIIETDNTYTAGTYLTGITVQNVKDADGKNLGSISSQATHDINGRILTETDSNGNVTNYSYDKVGRVTKIQYPDGSAKIYSYNTATNQSMVTDERGYVTRYQYDPAGNLIAVYSVDGGTDKLLKANEYDNLYRLVKEQNNLAEGGGLTTYRYDYKDSVIGKTSLDSANKTLSQENATYYDDKIIKTVEGDANSNSIVTTDYIDKYGRLTKKSQVINGTEVFDTFDYNNIGEVVKEKSVRANVESYPEEFTAKNKYDYAGNVIKQYDVNGNYITTGYDAAGRKISVTDAKSNADGGKYKTIYTYDALSRLIKEETPFTDASVAVTKYYYDANGNLIQKQFKNSMPGAEESYTKVENVYNSKNKLVQAKSYDGSTLANQVDYEYDSAGNVIAMKTAGGTQLTKYEYDQYGHLTTLTDPLGQKETYTYDINGNMTSKTDKNGNTINYTYDGISRKLSQSVTKDGVTQLETTGYTQTGALAFSQNENLRTEYTYNDQGKVSKENDSNGVGKEYTYDANGNVKTSVVKVNGIPKKTMSYAYDKKDRLIQVYEADKLVATYTYDVNGNRSSLAYGNGNSIDYAYNLTNLVTSLNNKKGTATLSNYAYTYYLNGNQATKSDNKGRLTSYNYDGLGRLTKEAESGTADAITKSYTFDAASNRASMTVSGAEAYKVGYKYDLNNRLATETKEKSGVAEITDYYYDNNGNTITKKTGNLKNSNGNETLSLSLDFTGSELYSYDGFDRMMEVQNSSGSSIYAYRPDGLRLSKTVNGVKATQVWEGQDISLELDRNEEVGNRYIRGVGLINCDKNGWYLFNAHGDVVQLTDNSGNVTKEYAYDTFGNEKNIDSEDTNPYRYSGEYYDMETGDIYLRARYYNPTVGRFISEDSYTGDANDPLSLNLYTYCENDPVNGWDPTGNWKSTDKQYSMAVQNMLLELTIKWYLSSDSKRLVINQQANDIRNTVDSGGGWYLDHTKQFTETGCSFFNGVIGGPESVSKFQRDELLNIARIFQKINVDNNNTSRNTGIVVGLFTGAAEEKIALKGATSLISNSSSLVRQAEKAGSNQTVQREMNSLIKQYLSGNSNPGLGSKNLFGNVYYLRGRAGARVFYRINNGTFEVLGKASKDNEQEVINTLKKIYEK